MRFLIWCGKRGKRKTYESWAFSVTIFSISITVDYMDEIRSISLAYESRGEVPPQLLCVEEEPLVDPGPRPHVVPGEEAGAGPVAVLLGEVGEDGVALVQAEAVGVQQEGDVVHGVHLFC